MDPLVAACSEGAREMEMRAKPARQCEHFHRVPFLPSVLVGRVHQISFVKRASEASEIAQETDK